MTEKVVVLAGVREYNEGWPVELIEHEGRLCVRGINEGGHGCTEIDLADLLVWLWRHRPELVVAAYEPIPNVRFVDPSEREWPKCEPGTVYALRVDGDYTKMTVDISEEKSVRAGLTVLSSPHE